MKKILVSIILGGLMINSLCGCGQQSQTSQSVQTSQEVKYDGDMDYLAKNGSPKGYFLQDVKGKYENAIIKDNGNKTMFVIKDGEVVSNAFGLDNAELNK